MIDVTLITGPLGAGKTTFIGEKVLPAMDRDGLTLLVNEAAMGGSANQWHTDGRRLSGLVEPDQLQMFGQSCVCCDGLDTFVQAIEELDNTKHLVIEPTGIANANNIVEALQRTRERGAPKYNIQHVTYLMPVQGFSRVEKHDGVLAADNIVLSWLTDDPAKVQAYLRHKSNAPIHKWTKDFQYKTIMESPSWRPRPKIRMSLPILGQRSHDHGHSHDHAKYAVRSFEINPYAKYSLRGVLDTIAERGVERAKGYIRNDATSVTPFDIVRGTVIMGQPEQDPRTVYGNGTLEVIDRNIPSDLDDLVEPITTGARDAIALRGASLSDMTALYNGYAAKAETNAAPAGFVPQTYEGIDTLLSLGAQIYQEHNDRTALDNALDRYIGLHQAGAAQAAGQDNEHFLGAMFGLKMLDAITEHDYNVDATDISRGYLTSLASLDGSDVSRIDAGSSPQEYRAYLRSMADVAKEYAPDLYESALSNMDRLQI